MISARYWKSSDLQRWSRKNISCWYWLLDYAWAKKSPLYLHRCYKIHHLDWRNIKIRNSKSITIKKTQCTYQIEKMKNTFYLSFQIYIPETDQTSNPLERKEQNNGASYPSTFDFLSKLMLLILQIKTLQYWYKCLKPWKTFRKG